MDFLVIDPARGLLALEVKGGGVGHGPDGWTQTGHDQKTHPIQDPGKQVQGAVRALDRYLREQRWFRKHRARLPSPGAWCCPTSTCAPTSARPCRASW